MSTKLNSAHCTQICKSLVITEFSAQHAFRILVWFGLYSVDLSPATSKYFSVNIDSSLGRNVVQHCTFTYVAIKDLEVVVARN